MVSYRAFLQPTKGGFSMLGTIIAIFCVCALICAFFSGNLEALCTGALSGGKNAVEFCLKICGSICFFCGLANVAQKAGITAAVSKALSPIIDRLIPAAKNNPEAKEAISMNLSSNMLGLGNAATPFGIQGASLLYKGQITRSLAVFILLNTCSVQIIPSTVMAVLQANGMTNPSKIILPVLITQGLSCLFGIAMVWFLFPKEKKKAGKTKRLNRI